MSAFQLCEPNITYFAVSLCIGRSRKTPSSLFSINCSTLLQQITLITFFMRMIFLYTHKFMHYVLKDQGKSHGVIMQCQFVNFVQQIVVQ